MTLSASRISFSSENMRGRLPPWVVLRLFIYRCIM